MRTAFKPLTMSMSVDTQDSAVGSGNADGTDLT